MYLPGSLFERKFLALFFFDTRHHLVVEIVLFYLENVMWSLYILIWVIFQEKIFGIIFWHLTSHIVNCIFYLDNVFEWKFFSSLFTLDTYLWCKEQILYLSRWLFDKKSNEIFFYPDCKSIKKYFIWFHIIKKAPAKI